MNTSTKIKNRINEICTHFLFDFKGKSCGVDPISRDQFNMWYGDDEKTVTSIDDVMSTPMFDGLPLSDILDDISITSW